MKIELCDVDRLIEVNNLKEVTSPRLFSNKMLYDPEGILSSDIFGISKSDRRTTFAYINLKRKFIHPHIYAKSLKSLFRGIVFLVAGQRRYSIKNGLLIEDPNGWTGLENLYNHWDEIDWSKSKSANIDDKEILSKLSKDQIFVDKIVVIPPAYRDVMLTGTIDRSDHVNELNNLYVKLIRSVSLLSEGGLFARTQYATQSKIQENLVEIRDHLKKLISKKQGLIRKYLIGKSVDYGVRSVISAPTYDNETFEEQMIDLEHTAVPIEQCCSLFYPFIEAWVKNFFTREILNDPNMISFIDPKTNKIVTAKMKDAELIFSEKNIKKMINDYCLNPDNRFKIIEIPILAETSEGSQSMNAYMTLKGKIILPNNATDVLQRPMTITDLLYLACVDVCEHRHVMVSRYPVGTDKGIYFNKIIVQSTKDHVKLIYNGKEYPYYPDIDLSTERSLIGIKFIDTLVMSNAHLDGMGRK